MYRKLKTILTQIETWMQSQSKSTNWIIIKIMLEGNKMVLTINQIQKMKDKKLEGQNSSDHQPNSENGE